MLFYLTNSLLDVTYGATYWVFKKGISGIYYGGSYLIYGHEDEEEKEIKNLEELTSEIKSLRKEIGELRTNRKPMSRSLSDSYIIINSRN